jgi:hypothetical protein
MGHGVHSKLEIITNILTPHYAAAYSIHIPMKFVAGVKRFFQLAY